MAVSDPESMRRGAYATGRPASIDSAGVAERLERWGLWAGIAFVVLFVVRFVAFLDTPESDAPASEWKDHLADSGNRTQILVGTYLMAFAGLAFLWFMASLFGRLRDIEDRPGFLTRLGYGAGAIFVTMLFGSAAAMGTVAAGVEFGDMPVPDGEFPRQFENLGFGLLLLFGMFAAGVFMAAVSFIGLHTALLPRWLAIAGLVAAPLVLLFGVVFVPMLLLVLWVLAVSIALLRVHPTPA